MTYDCAVLLVSLLSIAAVGCGKEAGTTGTRSDARRIEGGTPQTFAGVSFDLPAGWQANRTAQGVGLVPPNANPNGVLEEAFALLSSASVATLDGPEAERAIDEAVSQAQPGCARDGAVEKTRFGNVEGRVWRYAGDDMNGRHVEVRVYGFLGGKRLSGLIALGYADALAKRQADLDAILGSMTPTSAGDAPATGAAGAAAGDMRARLAGSWCYVSNVHANDGGRFSNSILTLTQDGSYEWRAESSSSNPFGQSGMQEYETGNWNASSDTLTLESTSGSKTFQLELRNHPKNVQDPMIVLDGRAYVTTTPRQPW